MVVWIPMFRPVNRETHLENMIESLQDEINFHMEVMQSWSEQANPDTVKIFNEYCIDKIKNCEEMIEKYEKELKHKRGF